MKARLVEVLLQEVAQGGHYLESRHRKAENLTRRRYVSCVEKLVISARNQQISKPKHKGKPATTQSKGSHVDLECDTDEEAFGASTKLGDSKGWIVDSGVSSHMTPVREILVNYVEFEKPQMVCLGDGQMVEALGRGNIWFSL